MHHHVQPFLTTIAPQPARRVESHATPVSRSAERRFALAALLRPRRRAAVTV